METSAGTGDAAAEAAEADEETPVPSFKICSVVRGETVTIVTSDFPEGETFKVQMGVPQMKHKMKKDNGMGDMPMPMPMPMPSQGQSMGMPMPMPPMNNMWQKPMPEKIYIPYYDAGTVESEGGAFETTLEIPAQLAGAYKINILMRTEQPYPYMAYNWFYNNTADVCNGEGGNGS